MPTVRDLVRLKNNPQIWSISPDATVFEAMKLLAEKRIGAVLVMQGGKIEGILSERDCVRKVDIEGKSSRNVKVKEIMTSHVLYIDITQPLEDCMAIMTEKKVRHLPVFDGDQLVAIVSSGDVLKEIISDQKFMLDQLTRYISGGGR
ncbi:MAG TPA: CBS domain-containing protein [Anaerolineales bacterium]|nr:CBS domain-containing protein [Anaerolineales bacterium]